MPLQDHMQIISVDDHLIEHPRVFSDRLPAKYLAEGPRIVEDEKGRHIWHFEDKVYPYIGLTGTGTGTGTGSWSAEQGEGFHHLGVSDPSVPARCTALGGSMDLISAAADGSPQVALTRSEALHGVRLEYFDARVAAGFLGYLRGR